MFVAKKSMGIYICIYVCVCVCVCVCIYKISYSEGFDALSLAKFQFSHTPGRDRARL